eukprot:817111-Amphidinium_carterae.1
MKRAKLQQAEQLPTASSWNHALICYMLVLYKTSENEYMASLSTTQTLGDKIEMQRYKNPLLR